MLNRRLVLSGIVSLALVAPAAAAQRSAYSDEAFQAAQAAGKSILVHVTAPWCGTCQVQKPKVAELAKQARFSDLVIFDVDYDTHDLALKRLSVRKQSVIITFKGATETSRSVGQTASDKILAQFEKAL